MNNEEKFKNKLTDAFDESHYEYDAGNWEKASNHLDAEDVKRKRRFFFWLFTGLGFGILVAGYLLLIPKDHKKQFALIENKSVTKEKDFIDSNVINILSQKRPSENKKINSKNLATQNIFNDKKKKDGVSSDLELFLILIYP